MNRLSQTVPLQYDTTFSPYAAVGWRAAFADLQQKGFTGVEIAVAYPDRIDADALLSEAQARSLAITTISTGQAFARDGLYLTAPDAEVRARAMDIVRGQIDLSARIGRPPVTIGLLRGRPEAGAAALALLLETMKPLVGHAARCGVILQIEPINRAETTLLNSTAEVLDFLDRLDAAAHTRLLFDAYHANIEDGDVAAAVRAAAGRITNFHVADSHRGLPGDGTIDFPAVLSAALDTGYTGAFALETLCLPSREYVLAQEAAALRGALEAAKCRRNEGGRNPS